MGKKRYITGYSYSILSAVHSRKQAEELDYFLHFPYRQTRIMIHQLSIVTMQHQRPMVATVYLFNTSFLSKHRISITANPVNPPAECETRSTLLPVLSRAGTRPVSQLLVWHPIPLRPRYQCQPQTDLALGFLPPCSRSMTCMINLRRWQLERCRFPHVVMGRLYRYAPYVLGGT